MKAEDVVAEFERLAADCTMSSFAERRLVKARAIRAVIEDRDELQRTFDLSWAAQMRAITAWQERHDEPLTWPDHERLVIWLIAERDALRAAALRSLNCLLGCVAPTGGCDDREVYEDAIAVLKRALKEPKP